VQQRGNEKATECERALRERVAAQQEHRRKLDVSSRVELARAVEQSDRAAQAT
jgi:hypothetical protein